MTGHVFISCTEKRDSSSSWKMLLDRGCPLDVADSRGGDTVLHLATRAGDNGLLAVLLRKGANPDIANKVGRRSSRFQSCRAAG